MEVFKILEGYENIDQEVFFDMQWLCPRKFSGTKLRYSARSPNIYTYCFVSFTFCPQKT